MKYLTRDTRGRHLSTLVIEDIQLEDSGEYTCQPAAGAPARVLVHVLQRETEVQAVLGEGETMAGELVQDETFRTAHSFSNSRVLLINHH